MRCVFQRDVQVALLWLFSERQVFIFRGQFALYQGKLGCYNKSIQQHAELGRIMLSK